MLLPIEVDFCASAIDVRLNSYRHISRGLEDGLGYPTNCIRSFEVTDKSFKY